MHTTTPHQFNQLSSLEKWAILEDHDTYLEVFRIDGKLKICLFAVFNYYIVYYHLYGVIKTAAFDSYKRLDLYIKDIDITAVYTCL